MSEVKVTEINPEYLHPACIECMKENRLKKNFYFDDGEIQFEKGEFPIRCRGILNEKGYRSIASNEEEYQLIRKAFDKAYWANKEFGWEPRVTNEKFGSIPYQEIMINCTSYRKIYRLGRRMGKCLPDFATIATDKGVMTLKELESRRVAGEKISIYTLDPSHGNAQTSADYQLADNGEQECCKVVLSDGRYEECTCNHPFPVLKSDGEIEFIEASRLNPGDYIPIYNPPGCFGSADFDDLWCVLLGLEYGKSISGRLPYDKGVYGTLIAKYGLKEIKSVIKSGLLSIIFTLTESQLKGFLDGFISVVGKESKTRNKTNNTTKILHRIELYNPLFASDMQKLLANVGIYASIETKIIDTRDIYTLTVRDKESLEKLYKILGKRVALDRYSNAPTLSGINPFDLSGFSSALNKDISWRQVIGVEDIGTHNTIAIGVPGTGIIANHVVSKNTYVMSIELVHDLETSSTSVAGISQSEDTIVTPAQAQRDEIFSRVREVLFDKLDKHKNDFKKNKDTPFPIIQTHAGAKIKGFVTGTSSSSDASTLRGQGGDKLLLDETAFIKDGDFQVILALLADHPHVQLLVSSTATGKNTKFYEWTQDPTYKEFMFPTTASPLWNKTLESELKRLYGPIAYKNEILVEFSDEQLSVFTEDLREAMFVSDDYPKLLQEVMNNRQDYKVTMGVDWNGSINGTQIAIVARHEATKTKRIIHRESINAVEFVQLKSIERIKDLNRALLPDALYVDEGYGATQYEVIRTAGLKALRLYGRNNPDARLLNAKPIAFNKNIKIKDPIERKKERNVDIKSFMVDTLILEMEERKITGWEKDFELNEQMANYQLVRVTSSGTPIYKPGKKAIGDHALDSFMLAILAFRLEFNEHDELIENIFTSSVTIDPYEEALSNPEHYYNNATEELHIKPKYSNMKEKMKPAARTSDDSYRKPNKTGVSRPAMRTINIRTRR